MTKGQKNFASRIVGEGSEAPGALLANPQNWRRHPKEQRDALRSMLRGVGWVQRVIVNRTTGHLVDGHLRVEVAAEDGEPAVPVIYVELTPTEEHAVLAAIDPIGGMADTDQAQLDELLAGLVTGDAGLDEFLVGLASDDASEESAAGMTDADDVPEANPAATITKAGDVWLMGPHRLICGDCRDAATVQRLMGGARINVAVTSPPYAEQREYDAASGFRPIPPDEYVQWYAGVASNIMANLADDGSYFCNIKPAASGLDTSLYVFDLVIAHVRQWGWHFATEFCWERNGIPKGVTRRFKNQFEPVYQFAKAEWKMRPDAVRHESASVPKARGKGAGNISWAKHQGNESIHMSGHQGEQGFEWFGDNVEAGLAYPGNRLPTFASSHEDLGHAAAFPVGLPEFFVKAYTDKGDAVFDPFMGSGSTLMAAERTGRRGFGTELSPIYCDVIVRRWQAFTGQQATLEATGEPFDAAQAVAA